MLIALILASSLTEPQPSRATGLAGKVVAAIDQNYLYANAAPWHHLRKVLLEDRAGTASSLNKKLAALHDGDLRIMSAEQMEAMNRETAGKERGIGLVDFAVAMDPGSGCPQIVTPLVDSPAYKEGLRPGDVILAVNGHTTRGLTHQAVMQLLRNHPALLHLSVRRGSARLDVHIQTAEWQEHAVESSDFMSSNQRLGYIGIRLFTPDSGDLTRAAVKTLETHGVNKIILDLRNNPGGYLDQMAVAGSAFTGQVLGWKVHGDQTREPIHSSLSPLKKVQLVILVNDGTASAAEVLAAGLHDTLGASLVGAKTFGRGQVQTYLPLGDGSGIIIPMATIEGPKGLQFNNGRGLIPDVSIPANQSSRSPDAAYQRAEELLTESRITQ